MPITNTHRLFSTMNHVNFVPYWKNTVIFISVVCKFCLFSQMFHNAFRITYFTRLIKE